MISETTIQTQETKKCPVCRREKAIADFLGKWACGSCHRRRAKNAKKWRVRQKVTSASPGMQKCGACFQEHEPAHFGQFKWCLKCRTSRAKSKKLWASNKKRQPVEAGHQRCTDCLNVFPVERFRGFNSCRRCCKKQIREAAVQRARRLSVQIPDGSGLCKKCLLILPLQNFEGMKMCRDCRVSDRSHNSKRYIGPQSVPAGKKYCPKCYKVRSLRLFGSNKMCGLCRGENRRKFAAISPQVRRERRLAAYLKNRDQILASNRCSRARNPETYKKWRKKNWKHQLSLQRAWVKKEKASNPEFRIACNCRSRIWQAVNKSINGKPYRTSKLLGCSWTTLKTYIESKWSAGMSWENYGKGGWVLDHIVPVSAFDMSNDQEILDAFYFRNLQPLWENVNARKSDKMPWEFAE